MICPYVSLVELFFLTVFFNFKTDSFFWKNDLSFWKFILRLYSNCPTYKILIPA